MAQDQIKKVEGDDLVDATRTGLASNAGQPVDVPHVEFPSGTLPPPLPPNLLDTVGSASTAGADALSGQSGARMRLPPALPLAAGAAAVAASAMAQSPSPGAAPPVLSPTGAPEPAEAPSPRDADSEASGRRQAKRRAAMPSRDRIAANDDAPSIGGLIYALNQRPSRKPFSIAAVASIVWVVATAGFGAYFFGREILSGAGLASLAGRPEILTLVATLLGPIGLMWALAVIAYRAEEMRLRSSAMTEVAVRLAEPDRMAEQSVTSLGQAVRRQVTFMNDAVTRALGRAGELESLVQSEVAALERSYADNERKIRGLIQELVSEREALVSTGNNFSGTLRSMSSEVPELIEKLTDQQIKLAKIIEGASVNLTNLESAMAVQSGQLESAVETRSLRLQEVLGEYTHALSSSLDQRMEQIGTTIASRTGDLQVVFEEYTRALDTTLDNRSQVIGEQLDGHARRLDERLSDQARQLDERFSSHANTFIERTNSLDSQLLERTQALDAAFNERLRLFDEAILRSTAAIDSSVGEKTTALTAALDHHARSLSETLSRQSLDLDESLLQGINAVRRTSENITRQSIKALEGLAGQSELLKNVSENLLSQINTITNRFDTQSQQIIRSANALETANYKIDKTLQNRHEDLTRTLDRLASKADEFNSAAQGYSQQIEGSISEAEQRARLLTSELARSTQEHSRSAIADLERMSTQATDTTARALDDLRSRFSNVTSEVTHGLSTLTTHVTESTSEARRRAAEAAAQLEAEQQRLRAQAQLLPDATRESADAMRRVLSDHLRAIDELSSLSRREVAARDVTRPMPAANITPAASSANALVPAQSMPQSAPPRESPQRPLGSLASALSQELQARSRAPASPLAGGSAPGAADGREGWSLGDLLKRASADDEAAHQAQRAQPAAQPVAYHQQPAPQQQAAPASAQHSHYQQAAAPRSGLDFAVAARALDAATASAIWQRLAAGQQGIMVRSIYTPEGRGLFDETVQRVRTDPAFAETTAQYLADFERVLQEADRQDPSGNTAQGHLRSDYGRVYLFLAHASGRIS